jgi:hypothetical protein
LVVEGGLSNSSLVEFDLGLDLGLGVGFDFGFGVVGPFPSAAASTSTSASSLGFLSMIVSLISLVEDEDAGDRSRLTGPEEPFATALTGALLPTVPFGTLLLLGSAIWSI